VTARAVSAALKRQLFTPWRDKDIRALLTVDHSTFGVPYRFVSGDPREFEESIFGGLTYNFLASALNGFTGIAATVTATPSGLSVVQTGADPILRSPAGLTINGAAERYIKIDVERTAVRTSGSWQGAVFYTTGGHPESGSFFKSIPEIANTVGAGGIIELDMASLTAGGNDWITNTIIRLRFDFDNGGSGSGAFLVRSIVVGHRTLFASKGHDFQPFPFELTLLSDDDQEPRATLRIQNVDDRIGSTLLNLPDEAVSIMLQIVMTETPDVIEYEAINMELVDVEVNAMMVTGRIVMRGAVTEPCPGRVLTSKISPVFFR
jgi:hypothetical protein